MTSELWNVVGEKGDWYAVGDASFCQELLCVP